MPLDQAQQAHTAEAIQPAARIQAERLFYQLFHHQHMQELWFLMQTLEFENHWRTETNQLHLPFSLHSAVSSLLQRFDHFSLSNKRRFNFSYFCNDSYWVTVKGCRVEFHLQCHSSALRAIILPLSIWRTKSFQVCHAVSSPCLKQTPSLHKPFYPFPVSSRSSSCPGSCDNVACGSTVPGPHRCLFRDVNVIWVTSVEIFFAEIGFN